MKRSEKQGMVMRDSNDKSSEKISDAKLRLDLAQAVERATLALARRAMTSDAEEFSGEVGIDVDSESVMVN
jgi:hypothetical protein